MWAHVQVPGSKPVTPLHPGLSVLGLQPEGLPLAQPCPCQALRPAGLSPTPAGPPPATPGPHGQKHSHHRCQHTQCAVPPGTEVGTAPALPPLGPWGELTGTAVRRPPHTQLGPVRVPCPGTQRDPREGALVPSQGLFTVLPVLRLHKGTPGGQEKGEEPWRPFFLP